MVHNFNLWISFGLMSVLFFSTPINTNPVVKVTEKSYPLPTEYNCTAKDIKYIIGQYYSVPFGIIILSGDMCAYTFQSPKGNVVGGQLFYQDCGSNCTIMILKSYSGETGSFQLSCDYQASDL